MIPSVEWVNEYRQRQIRFQHLYKDFLKTKTTELVNKMIVDPIVEKMRVNGVSRKIWENVEVNIVRVTDDGIYVNIHNEYFAESGFDVALAREEGTEDHWIRPTESKDGKLHWIQDGKWASSGGHVVSGLPRLDVISLIIDKNEYELQTRLNEEFRDWKKSIFS